jgi:hypothetical protein
MVPKLPSILKRAAAVWRRLVDARWLLLWLIAAWALAVGLPMATNYPEHGLDRQAVLALGALGPVGALVAAWVARPWSVLAAGLLGLVPPLVACPPLLEAGAERPWTSLLLAVTLLAAVDAALRLESAKTADLIRFFTLPASQRWRWLAALGALWLLLAWWGQPGRPLLPESGRAVRVAGVALCWSLVAGVPMVGATPASSWRALLLRRGAWLLLVGGLLRLWLTN